MSTQPAKIQKMSNATDDCPLTIKTNETTEQLKENVKKSVIVPNAVVESSVPITEVPALYNDFSDDGTVLKFKKLSTNAMTPMRGSRNAAGFDLFSAETKEISANCHGVVKTDISVMLPAGTYGRVAPRSGLAVKHFIDVGAGVVDFDYRGNIGVVLFNHCNKPFQVSKGDRIAQFIVEKICTPKLIEVTELDETDRGAGGYGSTGK